MLALRSATLVALSLILVPSAANAQWNGLYIGGTGTFTPGDFSDSFGPGEQLSGGMFGAQIGYRLQFGPAVVGVEADYLFGEAGYSSPARNGNRAPGDSLDSHSCCLPQAVRGEGRQGCLRLLHG